MGSISHRKYSRFELDADRVTVTPKFGGKVEVELDLDPQDSDKIFTMLSESCGDNMDFLSNFSTYEVLNSLSSYDIKEYVEDELGKFVADDEEEALDKIDKDTIIEYLEQTYNATVIE